MKNNWIFKNNLCKDDIISYLFETRNFNNETYEQFVSPTKENLLNPYLFSDMKIVEEIIKDAKTLGKKICIYGDYDVDGISSVSILLKTLFYLNIEAAYYIPQRIEEGYGININALDLIKSWDVDIIITVDCGITSIEEVEYANKIGITMIITDHHESKLTLPSAKAILNPKIENGNYPYKFLCGAGIALKIAQVLISHENDDLFDELIEIASIATIADIVKLTGENRVIVKCGLKSLKQSKNIGLKALIEISGVNPSNINSTNIAFILAPRLNSTGRMGNPSLGVELLTSSCTSEALTMARQIEELNRDRQKIELEIYEQTINIINSKKQSRNVIVAACTDWHSGVIGIVASKITEKFHKPSFIIAIENDHIGKGSARSIEGFNLFTNLNKLDDLLIKYGGHEQAAGITIHESLIDKFDDEINSLAETALNKEILQKNIYIDSKLDIRDLDFDFYNILNKLEPFGIGNRKPIFCISNIRLNKYKFIGKTRKHFKADLNNNIEMMAFNSSELIQSINLESYIDIVFEIDKNTYNNQEKIQLLIKDIKESYNYKEAWQIIDEKFQEIKAKSTIDSSNYKDKHNNNVDYKKNIFKTLDINQLLNLDGEKLIICYNPNLYIDLIQKLHYINVKLSLKVHDEKNDFKIILLPNIDKLDLSIYNNIIIYNKDFLLIEKKSELINKNIFELLIPNNNDDILPNRSLFIKLYNILKRNPNTKFDIYEICNYLNLTFFNLITMLEVFTDLDFINYKFDYDEGVVQIILNKDISKSNLEDSLTMKGIKCFFNI